MCGICGIYNYKTKAPVSKKDLMLMTDSLAHRGPDDEGLFLCNEIALGFRRLSIIDLFTGNQPMFNEDHSICVIFNGEIYNYLTLKSILESDNHKFLSKSDTEVIIHGYEKWGIDVLHHLNGMFGLAIWDSNNNSLILARDKMGIKPLYYKIDKGKLLFGSEIKAILAVDNDSPAVDMDSMHQFFLFRYTPSPNTLFRGVKKLAPGSCLILRDETPTINYWWKSKPSNTYIDISFSEAKEHLDHLYRNAVQKQLVSDVPLGLFLSGGVDSALLNALMNLFGNKWPSFTVGYGDYYDADELSDAAQSARYLNSNNFSEKLNQKDFETTFDKIINILEEPVAANSVVPMYHLCRLAKKHVKVAIMGQGPDELFAGYKRHLGIKYGNIFRHLPESYLPLLKNIIGHLFSIESSKRFQYSLGEKNRLLRYFKVFSIIQPSHFNHLFNDNVNIHPFDSIIDSWKPFNGKIRSLDELGGLQYIEIRSSLPDELLMYADKISMHFGLEVRVPYLDQDIVEFAENLPSSFKIKLFKRKLLHKAVANEYLPKFIVKRKKHGFESPFNKWLHKSINPNIKNIFNNKNSFIYNYLNYKFVNQLFLEHDNKIHDNSKILFSIILFEKWLDNYIY